MVPRSSDRRGTTGVNLNLSSGPSLGRPCRRAFSVASRYMRSSHDCRMQSCANVLTKWEVSRTLAPFSVCTQLSESAHQPAATVEAKCLIRQAVAHQVLEGGNGSADTCVVCDVLALVQGYIQISAHLQSNDLCLQGYDTLE